MKRSIFSILACGALLSASAAGLAGQLNSDPGQKSVKDGFNRALMIPKPVKEIAPLTRAGQTDQWFGYCGDYYTSLGGIYPYVLEAAIQIPYEMAQDWKGCKITKINVGFGQSTNDEITVYITDNLEGEAIVMQQATIETQMGWNEIVLNEPYEVTGDEFYIGYQSVANTANDYPLGFDGLKTNLTGTFVGVGDGTYMEFDDTMASLYGSICIRAAVEGNVKPNVSAIVNDTFTVETLSAVGEPIDNYISVINTGAQDIVDLQLTATVNGKTITNPGVTIISAFDENANTLPFGDLGLITINGLICDDVKDNVEITVHVTGAVAANGEVYPLDEYFTGSTTVVSNLYSKNIVVEEFTGTWCSWCPRGMVGMEYMEENYGDKNFIGIAVHATTSSGSDPMNCTTYSPLVDGYVSGFPDAMMDRVVDFDPSENTLEYYYNILSNTKALGEVSELKTYYNDDTNMIEATATVEFGLDIDNSKYTLAYVITENNVGPYYQQNAYAGGSNGVMGGWESKGRVVETMYNMVARYIDSVFGISGSLPTKITAQTPYSHSVNLPTTTVADINECYVIAMLLDDQAEVVNALKTKLGTANTGIETLQPADNGVIKVYNPQGVKVLETTDSSAVNSLPKGIYIINGKKVAL